MLVDLSRFNLKNKTVAVAISGGSDSVCLLHFLNTVSTKLGFYLKAINVEHGIRGKDSKKDSFFVKELCDKLSIPLSSFTVDTPAFCKKEKLSLEEGARILRYNCFLQSIKSGFCDLVATAHHQSDNVETLLFNLFRGSGTEGVSGIEEITNKGVIRPFINVNKDEINAYLKENNLSFVTDESNFDEKYTRNYLRQTAIPTIKQAFPNVENSLVRFRNIMETDAEFLLEQAKKHLCFYEDKVEISPCHKALFSRAVILALKFLGVKKDWEKKHVDDAFSLLEKKNGKQISLLNGIVAVKEYDKIVLFKSKEHELKELPFFMGEHDFCGKVKISPCPIPKDLKSGFYIDTNKIPSSAVIRTKREGDVFTKFGGGTKSLGDYFTDKKIPLRERDFIPLIADGKEVLVIFDVAISDKVKIDKNTKKAAKITFLP